jgi:hypothetical protein
MSRMPVTFDERLYSPYVVTRCSISGVLSPVYCQMILTTGMLISGKMSIGIAKIAVVPRNTMSAART